MSVLVYKLLLHICVWSRILQANGIQNIRYSTRFDNNQWRFGKRQDFLTKSRYFMWKPALVPAQLFSNIKKPAVSPNFNHYGIQSPPFMSPIHQSFVFAIPTKVNYAAYQQVKDIEEKRKQGNLHHITVINAIVPKPYLPTAPTHSHPTTTFKNYRTNNRQLYHQYLNSFGRQNIENINKINAQQLQLQQQQHHHQPLQIAYPSSTLSLQMDKPNIEYLNVKNPNFKIHEIETQANEINSAVSQCGRKTKDAKNSASDAFYYYCNNRITNYKNPTQHQLISIQPTTTSTSTTTLTTPTESPSIVTTKSSHTDVNIFTTAMPNFLPTPNAPLKKSIFTVTSTTSGNGDNFRLQKKNSFEKQQQTISRYEGIERQQQYTTAASYDNMKLHSFFTIEDAVTRAPEMQVFNDPYQAYRHARRQQINHHRQTTSTTKIPYTATTTNSKPKFKSFFDDLDDDDYITPAPYRNVRRQKINYQQQTSTTTKIPETSTTKSKPNINNFFDDLEDYIIPETHQYDYSLFSKPQKSIFYKSELKNEQKFPKHNQIIDYTHKATEKNEFITAGEILFGRPKIKDTHFGLIKSITPTTYALPAATTYKPDGHLKALFLTTHKIPSFATYSPKPIISTTTFDTVLENQESITEKDSNTATFNQVSTTTTLPIASTTEKKSVKITFKPPLNMRSSTAFKYPKHRIGQNQYKSLTSPTTKATNTQKKVPKYQRQHKTKKLKQFKHLYTTTSTTTTSTTTSTAVPSTTETHAKRLPVRLLPTTSSTEEPATKNTVLFRTFSTTELPKKKKRQQSSLNTEVTKRKNIKARTTTASTTKNTDSSIRGSARRGSKRTNIAKREKEIAQITTAKTNNKNRRRITSSSTTAEPFITKTTTALNFTSSFSTTPANLRTSTTPTIKSIMRIVNSKSRRKPHNDIKSSIITSSEVSDNRQAFNERISTTASIPPLPIEIYFKKSHNPKI